MIIFQTGDGSEHEDTDFCPLSLTGVNEPTTTTGLLHADDAVDEIDDVSKK